MLLSPNELKAFWKHVNAEEACPFCRSKAWILPVVGEGSVENPGIPIEMLETPQELLPDSEARQGYTIQLLHFICAHCGFVRSQHTYPLEIYLGSSCDREKE